jgi:nitrite reductase (NADH) small subunit
VEGDSVVCPWHSWTFNVRTGIAEFPVYERVDVFPVLVVGDDVLVDVEHAPGGNLAGNISTANSNF